MQRLPIEIMTYIANSLDLHDIFNLGTTCRQFLYLTTNEDICRTALEAHASYSAELQAACSTRQYARCLRRLVKIRDAIATASPYTAALVACADDFIYCNGMLCYTDGYESLRLLDLHRSAAAEVVIDTRALLQSVPEENLGQSKYKFRPVYYANGIVSCVYIPPKIEGRSRLVVVDVENKELLTCYRLESSHKLFVRNNQHYLYYGTHSTTGDDGFKRWALKQFNIRDRQWGASRLDLEHLVGSDMGATVCFEIIDDYFYALSSLTSFEVYETDWTSHYYGFRLPLGSLHSRDMQTTSKHSMWRRQHEEGPIDDRWSTLNLEKNAANGRLMVVECRREWLVDDSSSTRTSYRTELKFLNKDEVVDATSDFESELDDMEPSLDPDCLATRLSPTKHRRDPLQVHRGDSGSTVPAITLTHCFMRSYQQSCETFIDLVNEPAATDLMTQRPQLRSISRPRLAGPSGRREHLPDDQNQGNSQPHGTNKTFWWLPETDGNQRNEHLDILDNILNPMGKNHYGSISGVMDDRSMVYAVGQQSSPSKRPLVFISFDPAIRLEGLRSWPGGPTASFSKAKHFPGESKKIGPYPTPQSMSPSAPASRNRSFSEGCVPEPVQQTTEPEPEALVWGRVTSATYLETLRTIGTPIGFNFAYCGDRWGGLAGVADQTADGCVLDIWSEGLDTPTALTTGPALTPAASIGLPKREC
ncbi:F-box domain-containing protein [Colletotrichum truncatum]|uniref:F-box domain-containing protein n=1 Tax=Colletotrichum truncatum TaxID=5467 RepID=A0ACC3ZEF5_COLTU|nr:F-box domain-containing protein [Colletotrichum truncatum]KAF6801421.1 F-box domain-containing protein [Colletotrichum truncatum]